MGNGNHIRIEFTDNGIGIEDARKEEIFLRAYNKDKSISGLGLGLSLVKKIIETYKGQIWVEDRIKGDYSKGSNFIILLHEAD
jgi:signal transduction histidine kinase